MSQSTQLSTFNFEQSSIRVIAVNNEPWFVAKDVCDTLGIKNPTQALENLDEDERAMFNIGLDQRVNFDNRVSEINIVSESGMYTLILRCRDAVKKGSVPHRFRKWVTAEVLPQIRKTGQYSQNSTQIVPLEPKPDVVLPHEKAEQIAKYLVRARAFAKEVEVFHRKLYEDLGIPRYIKNEIAAKGYDIAHEFNVWLDPFIEQALPQLNQQRLARF
ncbi:BRO family protein [Glaesserella parasuis]|uniref:BRO-N domain-containing protein n=1 Tax=Glaesserella parasuis TaxID=738 RepID=UPI0024372F4C|nr:BRO family protein [Glaesserella parasuis]MDG6474325.1 BRO family protein [Glaesserella parasuis]MDO9800141.1 BRO family protein [Glaesserella parasuis]MDO9852141.1 BRO family protein [Glaesserella parasuis]MDO9865221.1 BRO family protein [Glaesserella parasuis]MDO9883384.1 BRO family protein [Glaesserella parasuis]